MWATSPRMLGLESVHFWQRRYYDFNVGSERKHIEKLRYIHRNPGVPIAGRFCTRWGGSR
jgi:hypothetical protein